MLFAEGDADEYHGAISPSGSGTGSGTTESKQTKRNGKSTKIQDQRKVNKKNGTDYLQKFRNRNNGK